MPDLPTNSINKIDKIYHFGYFFGGSGILCAALFTISRGKILPHLLLTAVVFTLTATGALDEWHQSTVPGRSGNDAMDLMADFLGSLVGFYFFRRFRFLLQSDSPTAKESVIFDKKPSK
jgi:VanZ family protein